MTELWLRFLPASLLGVPRERGELCVLVPIQLWHARKFGVSSQAELTGMGVVDSQFVVRHLLDADGRWFEEEAIDYCYKRVRHFRDITANGAESGYRAIMADEIERLPEARLGRQILSPDQRVSQEICIGSDGIQRLISEASTSAEAFFLLREIGLDCIERRHFDGQPSEFCDWVSDVLSKNSARFRTPKRWNNYPRDRLLYSLVLTLENQGFPVQQGAKGPSREMKTTGPEIVSQVIIDSGLAGARQPDTIRKVFQKFRMARAK